MTKCHEVVYDGQDGHRLCIAERFTEHTHADISPTMIPLPEGSQVTLDEYDYLHLVEEDEGTYQSPQGFTGKRMGSPSDGAGYSGSGRGTGLSGKGY